jgi:hypothetical protein
MGIRPTILDQGYKPNLPVSRTPSTLSAKLTRTYSWSAVVRGAVLYGVDGIVHTRKLKQHYGVVLNTRFIPGIHDEEDAWIDPFDGLKRSGDNVDWLAAKVTPTPDSQYTLLHAFFKDSK